MPEIINGNGQPQVGVIMGSKSDMPFVAPAFGVLDHFGVRYEVGIKSAHRTPEEMIEYAKSARKRGLQMIAAAAGGSAHLPGMVASSTSLPVVGIPIEQGSITGQNEAVGSMIRMPDGAPLVIVGSNKAKLAGEFMVRVLALQDPELADRYEASVQAMHDGVISDQASLNALGATAFMLQNGLVK